jgi:hypothetical protein
MKSFARVVSETIEEQGHVHVLFEQGMYFLAEDLERILQVFREARVPYEVIGGLAVNAHLMAAFHRSRSFLTRDIDFLVRRSDLDQIIHLASEAGYVAKKMMGGYALLLPGQECPKPFVSCSQVKSLNPRIPFLTRSFIRKRKNYLA